jgi:ABC-type molybdate transport system substrate-binding protein
MPHEPDQRSGERVKRIRIPVLLGAVAVLAALVLVACGGSTNGGGSSGNGNGGQVNLVAYSTPQEAYQQIIPAFQKTPAGKGVSFKQSYGASGDQERAVEAGLPADVVALSLAPDVNKLVKAELVAPSWNADRYHGFVTNSVVVFTVRKGNPKGIRTWDDLLKPSRRTRSRRAALAGTRSPPTARSSPRARPTARPSPTSTSCSPSTSSRRTRARASRCRRSSAARAMWP